jgi:hypothetical protein
LKLELIQHRKTYGDNNKYGMGFEGKNPDLSRTSSERKLINAERNQ